MSALDTAIDSVVLTIPQLAAVLGENIPADQAGAMARWSPESGQYAVWCAWRAAVELAAVGRPTV